MFIEFCVCTFFCHSFSPQVDSDLTAVGALGAAGKLLNACLSNSSLLTAYSLQQSLNFTNIITVPTLPNLGAQFDFGAVSNFSASVRSLGAHSGRCHIYRVNDHADKRPHYYDRNILNCHFILPPIKSEIWIKFQGIFSLYCPKRKWKI
jgi:hypothetical protein